MPYPTAEFDDQMPPTLFGNTFNQFEIFYAYLRNTAMFVETLFGEQIAHKSGVHFLP